MADEDEKLVEEQAPRRGLGVRLRAAFRRLAGRGAPQAQDREHERSFSLMYDRFREILSLNNATLEMFADLEDRLSGRKPFALDTIAQRARKAALDVFVMVKDLNQIAGGQHSGLYDALRRINAEIEADFAAGQKQASGPLALPLDELRATDAKACGNKMANLGEVRAGCGLRVPSGFAVTTDAFVRFMTDNDLWRRSDRLEGILEADGPRALADACAEVGQAIVSAPVPADVEGAVAAAAARAFGDRELALAVRSSAVGEDTAAASHAGLYLTRLDVPRGELASAYREVVASAFGASAVSYRFEHGLTSYEAVMGVACIEMVAPRASGIMFSRPPEDPAADRVVVSATAGLGAALAAGEVDAELLEVAPGAERAACASSSLLAPGEARELYAAARRIEAHFGSPQDIEWAIDAAGALHILQARPMVAAVLEASGLSPAAGGKRPLLVGGLTACPGVGSGFVVRVRSARELPDFPPGGVLVARTSSPSYALVLRRCAAVVTDVGSPIGHMSILAREYGVPAIVGSERATHVLAEGQVVTVDATNRCVFEGALAPREASPLAAAASLANSPAVQSLRRVARFVTPLRLTDPASPDFRPEQARSLHDITRYVHEKAFEVMFHYGDLAASDRQISYALQAILPIDVRVFDVGGGLREGTGGSGRVRPEEIASVPMRAFLEGLQDERIRWDQPRPISMRGFLSVMGESIATPPPEAQKLGRASYAIISDRYLNFSTKAGYHFSTVDTYCDASQNKNYVHFRFAGGGADEPRRARRVRFLSQVLAALDFKVSARADLLVARLNKFDEQSTRERLVSLGRLTLCVRQLDMLMSSDAIADAYARFFLDGEWQRF